MYGAPHIDVDTLIPTGCRQLRCSSCHVGGFFAKQLQLQTFFVRVTV